MRIRTIGVLASMLASAISHAQALSPAAPKDLVGGKVTILSTTSDSAGNRYVCGYQGSEAFIAKRTATGKSVWSRSVDRGHEIQPMRAAALKLDGLGNLYVAVNARFPGLVKLDAATGDLAWKVQSPVDGTSYDIAFLKDGRPITVGNWFAHSTAIFKWNLDGTAPNVNHVTLNWLDGNLTSVAVGTNGCVYVGGTILPPSGTSYSYGVVVLSPDLSVASDPQVLGNSGKVLDIVVDPVTDQAAAFGWASYPIPNGILQFVRASFDSGAGALSYNIDTIPAIGSALGGCCFQSATFANGKFYSLLDLGLTSGPASSTLYAYDVSPGAITYAWSKSVPSFGGGQYGAQVIGHDGGVSVISIDQDNVGGYHPYEMATWSIDGLALRRRILGDVAHPAPGSVNWQIIPRVFADFQGDTLNFYGPTSSGNGFWAAKLVAGPDDRYTAMKNTPLTWSDAKGSLMDNDSDGFSLNLTTKLTPGSLIQLDSVTVNSDGTFTATPRPGFAGQAAFSYDVYDGATYVATHDVIVRVKNDGVLPVAGPDSAWVQMNSSFPGAIDVLWNDVDSGELTVVKKTNGAHGDVTISPDGTYVMYKPKRGYVGPDSFTYRIRNLAGDVATGTVSITVGI